MNEDVDGHPRKIRPTDELFVHDERFSVQADPESPLLISTPARFVAVVKGGYYQVTSTENPAHAHQILIPAHFKENLKDAQLSPDGSIYLIKEGEENAKTLYRLHCDAKLCFSKVFDYPINTFKFSSSGKYLFVLTGLNFLNVVEVASNKLVTQKYDEWHSRLSCRLFKFSPDEKSVLFVDSEFDKCLYSWSFLEQDSPIKKVHKFEETISEFVLHPGNRLLAYATRYQDTVVVKDLVTKKCMRYSVGPHSVILSFAGDSECLYVISYNDSHWLNLRVYTLDDSELKGFFPFGEDVQQLFVDTQGNLLITRERKTQKYVLNSRNLSLPETVAPRSSRQALHLASFELLRAAYNAVQTLINEKVVRNWDGPNREGIYRVNSPGDWLKYVGHFATKYNRTQKDVEKQVLFPCTLIVGPENNRVTVDEFGIVKFNGAGASYTEISQFLERMLTHPDNELRATDFYQLLMGTLERELLRNHRELAGVLLRRIATNAPYPDDYSASQKHFLDRLLVLMIIVEGSRNNVSVLTTILLLDVISNHVFIDVSHKIYSFTNAFSRGIHEWEGPFKEEQRSGEVIPHNRGGFFPMAANATGSENLSQRRTAVEGRYQKFYGSEDRVTPEYFRKRPQKHHILLQEIKLLVDWLLWFHVDKLVPDAMKSVPSLFQQRLGQVFQFPNENILLNQLVNVEAVDDSYRIPGSIDRNQHEVVCVSHENTTTRTTTFLSYFHQLDRPCSNVPEYVVNGEEKELTVSGGAKHKFKSKSNVAIVNPLGITRSIQGPSNNRVIKCDEGKIEIFDQATVLFNGQAAQITPEDLSFMWECLARIYEFRLTYINREELDHYLAENGDILCRHGGLLKYLSKNITWRRRSSLKNHVSINFREIEALIDAYVYNIDPDAETKITDEDRRAILEEVIDLLLQVTRLKKTIYSTDLEYVLFSPKFESMDIEIEMMSDDEDIKKVVSTRGIVTVRVPAMSSEEIKRISQHPVLNVVFRKLLESHETYEFDYKVGDHDQLEPCPECFGRKHQSQALAVPKYASPCHVDEEKKRYHVLNSECMGLLQKEGLKVSYLNDSIQKECQPCENCWTVLTSSSPVHQWSFFESGESSQKKQKLSGAKQIPHASLYSQKVLGGPLEFFYQSKVLQQGAYSAVECSNLLVNPVTQEQFERFPVLGDGNCGFTAFGITREYAHELISKNLNDVRDILIPLIEEVLCTDENFIKYLPENFKGVKETYRLYREALEQRNQILEKEREDNLKNHAQDLNLLSCYVDYDVRDKHIDAGWSHPLVLFALAHIQKIHLRLWKLGDAGEMVPHEYYPEFHPQGVGGQPVDLLFVNGNHFERLNKVPLEQALNKHRFSYN